MLRYGLLGLLFWLALRFTGRVSTGYAWAAILIVALVFGLGHLPAMSILTPLTPLIVLRTVLLNAGAGIVYGWLYWRRGLEPAMAAHGATHLAFWGAALAGGTP